MIQSQLETKWKPIRRTKEATIICVQAHEACKHFHVRLRFKRNVLESYHARDLANGIESFENMKNIVLKF